MLQATPDYAQFYISQFQAPASPSGPPAQFNHSAAAEFYHQGLSSAAATAKHSISDQKWQRREQLKAELSKFLSACPYGHSLQTCSPEDLLVYPVMVYIPQHAGSVLPNGEIIAAPTTMATTISHLCQIFKQFGRGDTWDEQLRHGNPACSYQLHSWQQGHRKISIAADFRTTGAKEMTEAKMMQLQSYLSHLLSQDPHLSQAGSALIARDGLAFSLLWATGMRGTNAASIELVDWGVGGYGSKGQRYVQAFLVRVHVHFCRAIREGGGGWGAPCLHLAT